MPTSTLRLTTGFRYWNSLHNLVLFHKPPWRDVFSSDPTIKISAMRRDQTWLRTQYSQSKGKCSGVAPETFLREFNTFTGFFCSWGLLTSSFPGKKTQSGHFMNIWLGPEFNQSFLSTHSPLNWASATTALKWWGGSLRLFFCRLDTTALLLGTAMSYSVCTMCHFWTIVSSVPVTLQRVGVLWILGVQREAETTLNWNRGLEEDTMLSRVFILSLFLNPSFPFCRT